MMLISFQWMTPPSSHGTDPADKAPLTTPAPPPKMTVLLALAQLTAAGALVYFTYHLWKATQVLADATKASLQLEHRSRLDVVWDCHDRCPRATIVDRRGLPLKIVEIFKGNSNDTVETETPLLSGKVGQVIRLRRWWTGRIISGRLDVDPIEVRFSPMRTTDAGSPTWVHLQLEVWYRDYSDNSMHRISSSCTFLCESMIKPADGIVIQKNNETTFLDLVTQPTQTWLDDPNIDVSLGRPLMGLLPPSPRGEEVYCSHPIFRPISPLPGPTSPKQSVR